MSGARGIILHSRVVSFSRLHSLCVSCLHLNSVRVILFHKTRAVFVVGLGIMVIGYRVGNGYWLWVSGYRDGNGYWLSFIGY